MRLLTRNAMEAKERSGVPWRRRIRRRGPTAPARSRKGLRQLEAKLMGQLLHSEAPVDGELPRQLFPAGGRLWPRGLAVVRSGELRLARKWRGKGREMRVERGKKDAR